jgi:protein-S-isoprenylcysteine O-methyltransferase Ste14
MWRPGNVPLPEPYLFGIATGAWLQRRRPWVLRGTPGVYRLVGGSVIAAGTYLVVRSVHAAGQVRIDRPERLVTSGPYAVSRNPMYLGWGLLHLGVGAAARSAWILGTFPVAAMWIHRQVVREERDLDARFGVLFQRYRQAVPRYVPRRLNP